MPEIVAVSSLPKADADQIEELLIVHGQEKGYVWDERDLTVVIREGDRMLGGLLGRTVQGWLYIGELAVAEELRGQGYGRKLVEEAERLALERGCHGAWLNTHSFQAPGFYEKLGYQRFGTLDDFPPGEQRLFYRKRLAP